MNKKRYALETPTGVWHARRTMYDAASDAPMIQTQHFWFSHQVDALARGEVVQGCRVVGMGQCALNWGRCEDLEAHLPEHD